MEVFDSTEILDSMEIFNSYLIITSISTTKDPVWNPLSHEYNEKKNNSGRFPFLFLLLFFLSFPLYRSLPVCSTPKNMLLINILLYIYYPYFYNNLNIEPPLRFFHSIQPFSINLNHPETYGKTDGPKNSCYQ